MKRRTDVPMSDNQVADYKDVFLDPVDLKNLLQAPIPYRYLWAVQKIENIQFTGIMVNSCLDIGCHTGRLAFILADKFRIHVDAIEGYLPAIQAAQVNAYVMRNSGYCVNVYYGLFEDYNFVCKYSVITAFEIFEHFKDPMFCLEKVYDLLEPGGIFMMAVPEESGRFGTTDPNPWHYWTATIQSMVFTMFSDDKKWRIKEMFNKDDLIHILVQKL